MYKVKITNFNATINIIWKVQITQGKWKKFKINNYIIIGIIIAFIVGVTAIFTLSPYNEQEEISNIEQEEVNLQALVDTGLSYFNGDQPLSNQGIPCSDCHSLTAMGISGVNIGPDLSVAFLKPPNWFQDIPDFKGDKELLTNYLNGSEPSSVTMRLVLQDKPLTTSEIEALVELLIHTSSQE